MSNQLYYTKEDIKKHTKIIIQYADWIGDRELRRVIDMAAVNINLMLAGEPLYDIEEQIQKVRGD